MFEVKREISEKTQSIFYQHTAKICSKFVQTLTLYKNNVSIFVKFLSLEL